MNFLSISYDKTYIRENLTLENIYDLLTEFCGEPEYFHSGIISATICHNLPDSNASRKLYYYENTKLFHCYTGGCSESSFDIFELIIKIMRLQKKVEWEFNEAVKYIAFKFGIIGATTEDDLVFKDSPDWKIFNNYDQLNEIEIKDYNITLKEYDKTILDRFNYNVRLRPWLQEGIKQEALDQARIGFYPGGDQITIPHFDKDGRFIGLRGRALCEEDAERFGKYRPITVNKLLYNHPLGMNLYNLNLSKDNIKSFGRAIVVESEKSTLLYKSYFGIENDITVACCGSNLSMYQMQFLLDLGVKEVTIAFDRQFQEKGDAECQRLINKLTRIHDKYKNYTTVSLIFDKGMITDYKASPLDEGRDKFLYLFKNRIFL